LTPGKPVSIGDKCFVGCNVVIMPGVRLGANCVVGAKLGGNKVVLRRGSVIAGAPARVVRNLDLGKA